MKNKILIKRIFGVIIIILLFPLVAGCIALDHGHIFSEGFKIGFYVDLMAAAFLGLYLLLLWLFGYFD